MFSKPVEFDGIKSRVVELLPDVGEFDITRMEEGIGFSRMIASIANRKLSYTCFARRFMPLSKSGRSVSGCPA
ncbi:MAG: hypothetical protein NTZ39_05030 [Methanoregula sp.]|nr:hypothetical protein [Methanoregula sp.]